MPPANAPVNVGAGGNQAPLRASAACIAATGTPASTRMKPGRMSRMRFSLSVERTTSPIGVAPPVSDDCAPTTSSVPAAQTIAGISATSRGMTTAAACPPGKCAASERYFASTALLLRREPRGERVVSLDGDDAAHPVMREAAQLRARDVEFSLDRGGEPDGGQHAWDRVLLYAHRGDAETVDHVARGQLHDDRPADGQVHLIDRHDVVRRMHGLPIE